MTIFKRDLKQGMSGDDVKAAQEFLIKHGHSIVADGEYGPLTRQAVLRFQAAAGLKADGWIGEKTVARLMADPAAPPSVPTVPKKTGTAAVKNTWPTQTQVPKHYGAVGKNQTTLVLPYPMRIAWAKTQFVTKFSVHEKVHDSAKRVFERIANDYTAEQRSAIGIDLFGGCLNVRAMRGGSTYSMHSWGIAIDFDPERNQLRWGKNQARLAKPDCEKFWRAWEDEGWISLGRERNFDWMHVQAARLG